jgi:hypothetical protein
VNLSNFIAKEDPTRRKWEKTKRIDLNPAKFYFKRT